MPGKLAGFDLSESMSRCCNLMWDQLRGGSLWAVGIYVLESIRKYKKLFATYVDIVDTVLF